MASPTVASVPAAKYVIIDRLSRPALVGISLCYGALFFICVMVGVFGPSILTIVGTGDIQLKPCVDPTCSVTWTGSLSSLSAQNQFMYVTARLARPAKAVGGGDVLSGVAVTFTQQYSLDIVTMDAAGKATPFVTNATHVAAINCPASSHHCDPFILFYYSHIWYSAMRVTATFYTPLGAFVSAVGSGVAVPPVMAFDMGFVNEKYTTFELGWRAFFVTISGLVWIMYSVLLCRGAGTHDDATGARLPSSVEQRWAWTLGLLLIFFNDPTFAVSIQYPSFAATVFSALSIITFLACLLLYWLVAFHLAALQGESGLRWRVEGSFDALGMSFWIPKVILITLFWVIALSLYLYSRYQQLTDPAYSISESCSSMCQYFTVFVALLTAIYILFLTVLGTIALRKFRTLRRGNRWLIIVTAITALITIIGVYLDVFTPLRTSTASFLSVYGATNLYVWTLMFVYLPERKELVDAALVEDGAPPADTTGVMSDLDITVDDVHIDPEQQQHQHSSAARAAQAGVFVVEEEDAEADAETAHVDAIAQAAAEEAYARAHALAAARAARPPKAAHVTFQAAPDAEMQGGYDERAAYATDVAQYEEEVHAAAAPQRRAAPSRAAATPAPAVLRSVTRAAAVRPAAVAAPAVAAVSQWPDQVPEHVPDEAQEGEDERDDAASEAEGGQQQQMSRSGGRGAAGGNPFVI